MSSTTQNMKRTKFASSPTVRNGKSVPRLQNGDHLTVAEFERRYEAMPAGIKAELINGVVYTASPVRIENHADQHGSLMTWLGYYRAYTPGTQLGDNATLKFLLGDNQPQPDGILRVLPEYGGQSNTVDGYVIGGAELAAEVSASSVSYDLNEKFDEFEKNGVREYIVWRVEEAEIDWFLLKTNRFHRHIPAKDGYYKSKVFPGLWLDPQAMVADNMIKVLEVVQKGIASPEHQRFVKKLQARKK
jgi:hypothetical protein